VAKRPYQWERDFIAATGKSTPPSPAYERLVEAAFDKWETDRYSLKGWKAIAAFMRWDERNARHAYSEWPQFRRCIRKTGGRYAANPAELMNLQREFLCRREGRLDPRRRSATSLARARNAGGRFT
jgi:hypothetical protein